MELMHHITKEVKSINHMLHQYTSQIIEEKVESQITPLGVSREVAALLPTIHTQRIELFDVPLFTAVEANNQKYWRGISAWAEESSAEEHVPQAINWRHKAINRAILLFARDLARDNRKLCQYMLSLSKHATDAVADMTILETINIAQELPCLLFTLREGGNTDFWNRVATCQPEDKKATTILNNHLRMRVMTQLQPVSVVA